MKMLKRGDSGPDVQTLQSKLLLKQDSQFGPATEKAVIRFQLSNNLPITGIVDADMWTLLFNKVPALQEAIDEDTDIYGQYFKTNFDQIIHKHYLSPKEYIKGPIKNEYIFLHHTAGGNNPYACVDMWNKDDRGQIGTEFVLGGKNHTTGDAKYDGQMVQAFPTGNQGWHLGLTKSGWMNRHSVGLEICSMGQLTKDYKTYVGTKTHPDEVTTLKESFKGFLYWHSYSDKQIKETEKWIKYVAERDSIDIRLGLKQLIQKYGATKGFDYHEDAASGKIKGLLTHTNVRKDKSDCYPHPDLVDMIMSLK